MAALAALLVACRNAPLGTAVADDFAFLERLRFHRLDPLDSMGAAFYWRPFSRQLWFSLVGPWLSAAPLGAAALSLAMLGGTYALLVRSLSRIFPAPAAAAIAAIPLLAEPARALVTWPSGAQHLLALLGVALAVHEAVAGRLATGVLAATAGVASHESALVAFPALVLVRARTTGDRASTTRWALAAAGALAAWLGLYALALRHGVLLPPPSSAPTGAAVARAFSLFWAGALNLEDLEPTVRVAARVALWALAAGAALLLLRRPARARLRRLWLLPALCVAFGLVGLAPLTRLLPDWNTWRAFVPATLLGVGLASALAIASPWLAVAFAGVRLAALLTAPVAWTLVSVPAPTTTSELSFIRLARLQRIVLATRAVLREVYPRLPARTEIRYQNIPRMAIVGFHDESAVHTWYGDTTLRWVPFGSREGYRRPRGAVLSYMPEHEPLVEVEPEEARVAYAAGLDSMDARNLNAADSLLRAATNVVTPPPYSLYGWILHNQAVIQFQRGKLKRADSLNRVSWTYTNDHPNYYALSAWIALVRRDTASALRAARVCVDLQPDHSLRQDAERWAAAWSGRRRR